MTVMSRRQLVSLGLGWMCSAAGASAQSPTNGGFESGTAGWSVSASIGYAASLTATTVSPGVGNQSGRVSVTALGDGAQAWRIRLQQGGASTVAGRTYTLSAMVRGGSAGQTGHLLLQKNSSPWTVYAWTQFTTSTGDTFKSCGWGTDHAAPSTRIPSLN